MQMAADKKEMDQAKAGSNFAATVPVVLYFGRLQQHFLVAKL
jgi:hypothetical protein